VTAEEPGRGEERGERREERRGERREERGDGRNHLPRGGAADLAPLAEEVLVECRHRRALRCLVDESAADRAGGSALRS